MHQVQLGIHLSLPDDLVEIANRLGVFRLWQAMGLEDYPAPSRYGNEEPSDRYHTPPLDRSNT